MNMKNELLTFLALYLGLAAVAAQPVITNQPVSQTNLAGATVTFSVGATGAPPLSYQWVFNNLGNRLPGATNDTLVLSNVQASNTGNYRVVITNDSGSVLSGSGRLTVVTPPVITPANPTASLFADVTLVATSSSAVAPLTCQWLFNGEPIAGAVTNRLVVTNVQKTNVGAYAFVATYAFGSTTSQVATLKIVPFNSIYCFGYSWTATHNCPRDPILYYQNRACNGPMWPEFLSTNLGLAFVDANNVAACGAGSLDLLNQVINFPAPRNPQLSLYLLMFSDDILHAFPPDGLGTGYIDVTNTVAWNNLIQSGILNNASAVQRLYAKGARAIVLQNDWNIGTAPLGLRVFGTDPFRFSKLTGHIERYNLGFSNAVHAYAAELADLRILWVDLFSRLNDVLANPSLYGFTKASVGALDDTSITDHSFTGPGADYVFWDSIGHPTSKFEKLMTTWHLDVLTNSRVEKVAMAVARDQVAIDMNRLQIGRDYSLESSPDLQRWNDVQTFTASAGTNQVTQPLSAGTASVFYRLQWQQ
jgi:phospholipase/lecithinase/hemolysin